MNLLDKFIKKPATTTPTTPIAARSGGQAAQPSTAEPAKENLKPMAEGMVSTKDIIAPSSLEVDTDCIKIGEKYYRTVFTVINRRFVEVNWLSSLINFDATQTVSFYIYPSDGKEILDDLRRKIAEMEAEITTDIQRGRVVNPATQAKLEDALNLQANLVKGEERFFQMGLYITLNADTKDILDKITKNLEATMGSLMVLTKKTNYMAEDAFVTNLPIAQDRLKITRNMDTTSLATTFPFVSSDLSDDKGVMFGINEHNGSLVIFDRFSMPNYNSVVFATAGAGKSYMIKLEALRSVMLGTDVIVIDPENEYKDLAEAIGGQYIAFGYQEDSKINPFDLSLEGDDGDNALNSKILTLHKLFKIMIGEMDPIEESILDRAVMEAYKAKGITPDPETQQREPPLIEDLYKSLIGMEDQKAASLAARVEKYIKGSFAGIFNQKTNVNLESNFVVFGIRNLEDALRPMAMQIILDYIWTVVKKELKRRILVVDEAWYLMQYPDSASFLRGIVKRGRKYYLGVTTITQDVDDFLQTPYGKEIVTNSSIQILLKQHSAAIDQVGEVFYLSEGEKQLLLSADKGEGIFFAGQNHVAIRVIASDDEHKLITSNPEEILKMKKLAAEAKAKLEQTIKAQAAVMSPMDMPVKPKAPIQTAAVEPTAIPEEKTTEETKPEIIPAEKTNQEAGQTKTTVIETSIPTEMADKVRVEVKPTTERKALFEPEVETVPKQETPEDQLRQKIADMEEAEKIKIEDHKKRQEEEQLAETKANDEAAGREKLLFSGGLGKLPSYQELFKSNNNKLPPLPPTPKFDAPTTEVVETPAAEPKKPSFVNTSQNEVKIPQPPQLKKTKIEMVKPETPAEMTPVTPPTTPTTEEKSPEPKKPDDKMTYDDLFGNGIV